MHDILDSKWSDEYIYFMMMRVLKKKVVSVFTFWGSKNVDGCFW